MKSRFCYLVIILVLCLFSCVNKIKINANKEIVKVLFEEEQNIGLWTIFEKGDDLYLLAFSKKDTLIHILKEENDGFVPISKFALDAATLDQLIEEDKVLLNSHLLMLDTHLLLIVPNNYLYSVYDVNKQQLVFQRIQKNDSLLIGASKNDAMLYDKKRKKLIYFPFNLNSDGEIFQYKILAGENIYTGQKELYPIYFLQVQEFKDGYVYLEQFHFHCIAGNNKYVTTQSQTSILSVYDIQTQKIENFNIISDNYTPYPKEYKDFNFDNDFIGLINFKNKSMTCDYYNHCLLYDEYKKIYYRFFSISQPEYNEEGLKNTINSKHTGVSLIDENFNYIGDYVEENLFFMKNKAIPTSTGLMFLVSENCHNGKCGLKSGKYEVVKLSFDY